MLIYIIYFDIYIFIYINIHTHIYIYIYIYDGNLLMQSIYDDDNDRSKYLQDAVTRQTNLKKVVVKCQGGYCDYSNIPLIIVIKS